MGGWGGEHGLVLRWASGARLSVTAMNNPALRLRLQAGDTDKGVQAMPSLPRAKPGAWCCGRMRDSWEGTVRVDGPSAMLCYTTNDARQHPPNILTSGETP